jgi:hypothetical protein
MFPSFGHLWSTPARCGTLILLRILRNFRKCISLLYVSVLNNGILIIRPFYLFLTSQHLPHGGNTLTSAQCSTLSTSCHTSLKKSLSLEPHLYTRQITYIVSLFVGLTRTLTHLYQRPAQTGTHPLFL